MFKSILMAAASLLALALAAMPSSAQDATAGAKLYATHCSACHGANRAGIPGTFPTLVDVNKRLSPEQIKEKIKKGGGLMPPFGHLSEKEIEDISVFLKQ